MDEYTERLQDILDQLNECLDDIEASGMATASNQEDLAAIEAAVGALEAAIEGLGPAGEAEPPADEPPADEPPADDDPSQAV